MNWVLELLRRSSYQLPTSQTAWRGQMPRRLVSDPLSCRQVLVLGCYCILCMSLFLADLGHRISSVSGYGRETSFLHQQISVLCRFNSVLLHLILFLSTAQRFSVQLFLYFLTFSDPSFYMGLKISKINKVNTAVNQELTFILMMNLLHTAWVAHVLSTP